MACCKSIRAPHFDEQIRQWRNIGVPSFDITHYRLRKPATPSPDYRALLEQAAEALDVAADRIHRMAFEYGTGTRKFMDTREWSGEARSTLATIKQKLAEDKPND